MQHVQNLTTTTGCCFSDCRLGMGQYQIIELTSIRRRLDILIILHKASVSTVSTPNITDVVK